MHFGQRTGSGHVTISHTNMPSSQPSISLTHHHPHLYRHLQRGTAPPGRSPDTQHIHQDLRRMKTWPRCDSAPNGGGDMQGGAGYTEGANGWAYKVRPPFFLFLLFTDYPLQLPHLPNTKNATHSRVFRVRRLSCPSPCPPLSPCSPTQRTCPCGHILHAGLLPYPPLHSHHPQDMKNTQDARVFRVWRLPCSPLLHSHHPWT